MMHGSQRWDARQKPLGTDQVLNRVYSNGKFGKMGLFQIRGFLKHHLDKTGARQDIDRVPFNLLNPAFAKPLVHGLASRHR